jgi:hypothetical protein
VFFVLVFVRGNYCFFRLVAFVFDCLFLTLFSVRSSWLLLWWSAISSYSLFVNVGLVLCFARVRCSSFDYYELLLFRALGLLFVIDIILVIGMLFDA